MTKDVQQAFVHLRKRKAKRMFNCRKLFKRKEVLFIAHKIDVVEWDDRIAHVRLHTRASAAQRHAHEPQPLHGNLR